MTSGMQEQSLAYATTAYPVKVMSRTLPASRSNKLRIAWFILGTAFGIGCTSALSPIFTHAPLPLAAQHTPAPAVASAVTATPAQAALPASPPLQTMAMAQPPTAPIPTPPQPLDAIVSQPHPEQWGETPAQPDDADTASDTDDKDQYPLSLELKVENGDTLMSLLTDAGAPYQEASNAIGSIKRIYDPKKLDIGQNISVQLDKNPDTATSDPVIASLKLPLSPTTSLEVTRKPDDGSFAVQKVDAPVEEHLARSGGKIDSSLYETGIEAGLPPSLISDIMNAYSYDVDFQRDIHQGDTFDVLYERMQTKDGTPAGYGNVIFAELELGNRVMKVYRYVDKNGNADYYNEKGECVRKALLRTPINGARITSGYGMRNHPLLGYTRMHRGVDFGAPTGTPIYASGDGVVEFVGRKGGYGNYLRLRHNNKYESAYGHISRFAAGIVPGRHVKQGQIIAYVGSTGMATGPHLHYEILVSGTQVNPANVKFKTGNVLTGRELVAFRQNMGKIEARMAAIPQGGQEKLAMASPRRDKTAN